MIKRYFRVVAGLLIVVLMVLASCSGGDAEEEAKVEDEPEPGKAETIDVTLTKRNGTTMTKTVVKPIYGGTIVTALTADYNQWDPYHTQTIQVGHMQLTSNELIGGDWTLGPQGTEDTDWALGWLGDWKPVRGLVSGCLTGRKV